MTADSQAPLQPLLGVRVVDLTRLLPGPFCTWILASLGAQVCKVEDTGMGDYARAFPPSVGHHGALFHVLNRGNRSLAVDLKCSEGREILLRLLETADVLVEGFRPGVMEGFGFGPSVLRSRFPRLVGCSISGYGNSGPLRQRAGHDLNYLALAGVLANGMKGGQLPSLPALPIADLAGGALPAAIGVLASLLQREKTGKGTWVDVGMMEVAASLAAPFAAGSTAGGGSQPGQGMLTGDLAWYRPYRCQDGQWLAVAALEPRFYIKLAAALGHPEWAATSPLPGAEQERLSAELSSLFATRTRADWLAVLGPLDVCVEPLLEAHEALAEGGPLDLRGRVASDPSGARWAEWPMGVPVTGESPGLGEHSSEILAETGWSEMEIAAFKAQGVVR